MISQTLVEGTGSLHEDAAAFLPGKLLKRFSHTYHNEEDFTSVEPYHFRTFDNTSLAVQHHGARNICKDGPTEPSKTSPAAIDY